MGLGSGFDLKQSNPLDKDIVPKRSRRRRKKKEGAKKERKKSISLSAVKWWRKDSIVYAFNHTYVRSRLEKLMGTNVVSLTDREYMQKLQERILQDYANSMDRRVKNREDEEKERVKYLVLTGKIPLDQAPESMADHPIMQIESYCNQMIAERRAKIKIPRTNIPKHLYIDDTPDPPSGLSIEKGHVYRKHPTESLCHAPLVDKTVRVPAVDSDDNASTTMSTRGVKFEIGPDAEPDIDEEEEEAEEEEEYMDEYMLTQEEFDRLRYEEPAIKELKQSTNVEEMYTLAELIVGSLQTIESRADDTTSVSTGFSNYTAVSAVTDAGQEDTPMVVETVEEKIQLKQKAAD